MNPCVKPWFSSWVAPTATAPPWGSMATSWADSSNASPLPIVRHHLVAPLVAPYFTKRMSPPSDMPFHIEPAMITPAFPGTLLTAIAFACVPATMPVNPLRQRRLPAELYLMVTARGLPDVPLLSPVT